MAASPAIVQRYQIAEAEVPAGRPLPARPGAGETMGFSRLRGYEDSFCPNWHRDALSKVISLVELPENWDGYGSEPLRHDTAMFALQVLSAVMQPRTPMPEIVPSAGGVQFEWHERGIDLELHVTAPYEWEIWFEDLRGEHEAVSDELTSNFSSARAAVSVLTKRS